MNILPNELTTSTKIRKKIEQTGSVESRKNLVNKNGTREHCYCTTKCHLTFNIKSRRIRPSCSFHSVYIK